MASTAVDDELKNGGAVETNNKIKTILSAPEKLKQKKRNEELEQLTREELVERVVSLEKHVQQLRNVIAKNSASQLPAVKENQKERKFDFNKFKRRHVLLKVCYFGWDYLGFATQEDAGKTIESELFAALLKTRLIESRETSNYHRCGRTDRGVSAFSQVISLDIRTNLSEGEGIFTQEGYTGTGHSQKETEIDFCNMMNRNLPDDIKVTAWAPCPSPTFSARFDCEGRTYKYFFPRGGLNIDAMEAAAHKLRGEWDFRNFCKMDVNNGVVNYMRRVDGASVEVIHWEINEDNHEGYKTSPYDMCVLTITGKAYLWHQIRCILTVLFLVGEEKEQPEVIDELLDVEKNPCRPAYGMAADLPLNLFSCGYEGIEWRHDQSSLSYVIKTFQKLWTQNNVRAEMIKSCLYRLESHSSETVTFQHDCLTSIRREKSYTPLMQLPRCPSLEDKILQVAKRRKLNLPEEEEEEAANCD